MSIFNEAKTRLFENLQNGEWKMKVANNLNADNCSTYPFEIKLYKPRVNRFDRVKLISRPCENIILEGKLHVLVMCKASNHNPEMRFLRDSSK